MTRPMWINGAFITGASGRVIEVYDPATEEVIETVPAGDAQDVTAAVDAAHAAFAMWRRTPAGQRAELLHEVANKLTA
ncbi:MAG TPA: aldehyde dehydrogenase family protein, partial [Ktedonobacterales bacterium]|nr:aldehyde dehydrogenase family protein [Ktedonobacterales bacterium]